MFAKFFNLMLVWSLGVTCSLKTLSAMLKEKPAHPQKNLSKLNSSLRCLTFTKN